MDEILGRFVAETPVAVIVQAAYRHTKEEVPVSVTSLYNKVNGLEPGISQALVQEMAAAINDIIDTTREPNCNRWARPRLVAPTPAARSTSSKCAPVSWSAAASS